MYVSKEIAHAHRLIKNNNDDKKYEHQRNEYIS